MGAAETPVCPHCLRHIERPDPDAVRRRLARSPQALDWIDDAFCLWMFDRGGRVQRIQHRVKYGNRPLLGQALGRLMGLTLAGVLPPADGVIAVPLHPLRRLERGYNQSRMLAGGLAEICALPLLDDVLLRTRATRSQTRLSRHARIENVRGAFSVTTPDTVTGRALLLVDDVLTTGATGAAAARALRESGALGVTLVTLALARS